MNSREIEQLAKLEFELYLADLTAQAAIELDMTATELMDGLATNPSVPTSLEKFKAELQEAFCIGFRRGVEASQE